MHSELFFTLNVKLGDPLIIGQTNQGFFKIIPITGGDFKGQMSGKILSFGGDFNYRYDDCYSQAHARYVLECEGEYLYIDNTIDVDKKRPMLTHLHLTCDQNGKFSSLNYRTFLGKLVEGNDKSVIIEVYEVTNQ